MSCFDGSVHQSWHCSSVGRRRPLFASGRTPRRSAGGGLGDARIGRTRRKPCKDTSRRSSPVWSHRCSTRRCTSLGTARRRTRRPLLASGRTPRRSTAAWLGDARLVHTSHALQRHQSQKWPGCSTRMGLPASSVHQSWHSSPPDPSSFPSFSFVGTHTSAVAGGRSTERRGWCAHVARFAQAPVAEVARLVVEDWHWCFTVSMHHDTSSPSSTWHSSPWLTVVSFVFVCREALLDGRRSRRRPSSSERAP